MESSLSPIQEQRRELVGFIDLEEGDRQSLYVWVQQQQLLQLEEPQPLALPEIWYYLGEADGQLCFAQTAIDP